MIITWGASSWWLHHVASVFFRLAFFGRKLTEIWDEVGLHASVCVFHVLFSISVLVMLPTCVFHQSFFHIRGMVHCYFEVPENPTEIERQTEVEVVDGKLQEDRAGLL